MKNLIFVLALVSCGLLSRAQEGGADTATNPASHVPSYAVKWNPVSLFLGKIGLQGEYNFKNKRSLTLGIGVPVEMSIGYKSDGKREKLRIKTFSAMAGYRFYLGKHNLRGLYLEPYLKYVDNQWTTNYNDELDGKPTVFVFNSEYSGFGAGAQLGAQFALGKRWMIDLFFLGPEANISKHELTATDVTSTTPWDGNDAIEAQVVIESVLRDEPIIGKRIKVKVDATSRTVTSNYDGFLPGLRAGFSIGFRL